MVRFSCLQFIGWYCGPYYYDSNPNHLIVIVGGYCGHYVRCKGIYDSFKQANISKQESIMIYLSNSNHGINFLHTLIKHNDGIDKGGKRLYTEIKHIICKNKSIHKISVLGCSLGGLYIRYCLKLLFNNSTEICIDNRIIKGMNYFSLASPHTGINDIFKYKPFCCFKSISLYETACFIQKYSLLPKTLKQLMMINDELLINMANNDEYLKPLQLFQNRIAFGNGKYDKLVSCSSALLFHGTKEAKIGLDFWDKMVSQNNKFLIENLSEKNHESYKNNKQDQDSLFCWFHRLKHEMKWIRIIVCWNQSKWSRNSSHPLLAAPFSWHSGCITLCQTIIDNFQY